jgi:hypothetical protein
MITIRPHNPHDYAVLPDIDDRQVQSLTRADSDCLDKLGNFLVMAHANDRFGASLLHRHFPVLTNELFIEELNYEDQTVTLAPKGKVTEPVCPINFCFSADRSFQESVPTFFRWRLDALNYEGTPIISQTCKTRCNVTRGCLVRPDGGHETHSSHDPSHES